MTNLICITCPKGCHLSVDEENGYQVTGNDCPRGAEYGRNELLNPVRVVTSTVRAEGGAHPRIPVKTDKPVPKKLMFEVMKTLDEVLAQETVKAGDILVPHVCGTDANIVATKAVKS